MWTIIWLIISDALQQPLVAVENGQRVPQNPRLRLKKIVGNKTKNWKKKPRIRIGNWNIGSLTGKGRELVDVMQRRNIKILCIQETKWKGNSARKNMRRIQSVLCWRKYKEKWSGYYSSSRCTGTGY